MALGKRLAQAMEHRGMDQVGLAKAVEGASQPAISALITRDSKTSTLLFPFAKALNVNPQWLQDGTGDSGLDDTDAPLTLAEDDAIRAEINDYWKHLPAIAKRKILADAKHALASDLEKAERVNSALRKRLGIMGNATDRRVEETIGYPPENDRRKHKTAK